MKMTTWMLTAAVAMTLGCGASNSFGEGVLDEGLGGPVGPPTAVPSTPAPPTPPLPADGPPAKSAEPVKAADAKPADPKLTRPKMPDMVSPDASKTVDDQDLVNKLTGKSNVDSGEGGGPAEKMKDAMDRMGQAQNLLTKETDPGAVTQETQQRIVMDLDATIEYLKKQQQQGGGKGKEPKPGDKPQKSESKGQQQGKAPGQSMGGTDAAKDSNMRPGSADAPIANDTDIHQTGTNWGGLPPGDRELVAHGANEHYLPEYKDMIKRYYEALAEIGRTRNH